MKRNWVQILANLGVLIGLVVLIYEVRQSNLYARADSANANYAFAVTRETSVVGENLSDVLAKGMDDPDSLTTSEIVVLDAYHRQFLMELIHWAHQSALGLVDDGWQENFRNYVRLHLDYPFGRKWWSRHRVRMGGGDPDAQMVVAVIDDALDESGNGRLEFFQSLKSK